MEMEKGNKEEEERMEEKKDKKQRRNCIEIQERDSGKLDEMNELLRKCWSKMEEK